MRPGGAAKNVLVILEHPGVDDFGASRQSRTDEKGIFKLKGIPPGSCVIVAYEEREGVMTGQARQKVEIGGESIESLTISLGSVATFQGRVTVSGSGALTSYRNSVVLYQVDAYRYIGVIARVKHSVSVEF